MDFFFSRRLEERQVPGLIPLYLHHRQPPQLAERREQSCPQAATLPFGHLAQGGCGVLLVTTIGKRTCDDGE